MPMQQPQIEPSASSSSAADLRIVAVPPQSLERLWGVLEPLFADVLRRNVTWTLDAMLQAIVGGQWHLWMVWRDGEGPVAITASELGRNDDGSLTCNIPFCAGQGAKDFVPLLATIERWARSEGCRRMKAVARKGWARHLPDYKMTHVVLEKDL